MGLLAIVGSVQALSPLNYCGIFSSHPFEPAWRIRSFHSPLNRLAAGLLFGVRGKNARTLAPGRSQVNMIQSRKREHSRKPDEQYRLIESCSPGPYLELFSRGVREEWAVWGNQADDAYTPNWATYKNHSQSVA